MRALTLTQPWAGLVASGLKLVENRSRQMIRREDFGVPFAIHASREIDEPVYARIRELAPELIEYQKDKDNDHHRSQIEWYRMSRITSAVIAVATIERVVFRLNIGLLSDGVFQARADGEEVELGDQRRWFFGPVGYVLRDVRALPRPVSCRGWQGFWTLPDDVERAVTAQMGTAP